MKICKRGINFLQLINAEGKIRTCSWMQDNVIGNLLQDDLKTIIQGEKATKIRQTLIDATYEFCPVDNCPYLANGKMEEMLIDIEELPEYPDELYLAYEGVCNYDCTCCTSHEHMEMTKKNNYSHNYDILEQKLKEILPYVKSISANGRGELFASKRILKLLSEWIPLAPAEEIHVALETNGSLFDEKHWEQIQNLGQYDLEVDITVMSFEEDIYQHLSGCRYPISKIEDNLRFVKKLREQGIINYLELATVLQEENFREMPQFAERCINEFGADCVRIRPIMPGGRYDRNLQWFMDVRNPEHPYYEQYLKVMQHPVFKNPKVLLWSGNLPSTIGKHPGEKSEQIQKMADYMLNHADCINKLLKNAGIDDENPVINVYGIGTLGKMLVKLNKDQIKINAIYDKNSNIREYDTIPVLKPNDVDKNKNVVIVTVYNVFEQIKQELIKFGFEGKIIDLYQILK